MHSSQKLTCTKNRGATDAFHRKLSNCNYSINDLIFIHKSPTTCLIITQHRVLHYQVLNATLCYRNINDDYYSIFALKAKVLSQNNFELNPSLEFLLTDAFKLFCF